MTDQPVLDPPPVDDTERAKRLARRLHDEHGWSYRRLGLVLGWKPEWTRRWVEDIRYPREEP